MGHGNYGHTEALLDILANLNQRNMEITCPVCGAVWPPCSCDDDED